MRNAVNPECYICLRIDNRNVDPSRINTDKICKIVGCKAWQGGGIYNLVEYGFICLDEKFGGWHFFAAQRIPEA